MQTHVGLWILFLGRCTNVSDTYVVSDPCIATQHEFGTNSARTIDYGQFRWLYRVAEGRLLVNTDRPIEKRERGTYRKEGWRHLRT